MRIVSTTLWLPKHGNSNDEYEDAAAPLDPQDSLTDVFRCAVADGATETSFSGLWAKLLVNGYIDGADRTKLKQLWSDAVSTKTLPWYAEQKAESGAYAALVGVTIKPGNTFQGGTWESEAIGDCCLLIFRGGELIEKFPMEHSEQFNSSPVLLSSNFEDDNSANQILATKSGAWENGDVFYLLSDAIARWALKRQEEHRDVLHWLAGMNEPQQLIEFVDLQRSLVDSESRPLMRNDDVTLLRVLPEA